jgi:hypothetical protein
VVHDTVGTYVTRPIKLHGAVSRAAKAKPRRQRTAPEAATFTAAGAVVGALRGSYLYREAGEGADEIVELAHGDARFDRDDLGGESGQHSVPL